MLKLNISQKRRIHYASFSSTNVYFLRPSFFTVFLYSSKSVSSRYFKSFLRFPTICINPLLAIKSCLLFLTCSVTSLIRSVKIETCTSGEPTSALLRATLAIALVLFSFVIIAPLYHICYNIAMNEDQIILIDKPAGISSFGVVAKVRRRLTKEFGHKVKVGHTGTLDPFATGLLILLSGKYTKKSGDFLKLDKVYEATMKLGYVSSTGDPEGEITKYITSTKLTKFEEHKDKIYDFVAVSPLGRSSEVKQALGAKRCDKIPDLSHREASEISEYCALNDIKSILASFTGTITQTPPRYSAIKINGQRAYKLARQGKTFDIPSRQVEIYSIEILHYDYPYLTIRVHCSSGTYIRTLAEDIGKALGTGAYLTTLRRLQIGEYTVANAKKL